MDKKKRTKAKTKKRIKINPKGVISVFLVIILVPCLLVSSIFVDTGRVMLAQSITRSAADLALDSLLTNYDFDLKEWYGLAASCQSIEEFYSISADYFLRTMQSKGLTDDEIYLVSDYYANATNDDTIYDLINAKCLTKKDDLISKVNNGDLTNDALMKREIVEFMKYRAPIELTKSIIERLKADKSFKNAEDSDKDKELSDKKQEFFEADSALLEAAYNTYVAIRRYQNGNEKVNTNPKLEEYAQKIEKYKSAYQYINLKTVNYIIYTDGLQSYHRPKIALSEYEYGASSGFTEKSDQIYTSKKGEGDSAEYYISTNRFDRLCDDLEKAIREFEEARDAVINKAPSIARTMPGDDINPIRWAVRVELPLWQDLENVNHKSREMMTCYAKVNATVRALTLNKLKWENDITPSPGWESRADDLVIKAQNLRSYFLDATSSGNDFADIANNIEAVTNEEHFFHKQSPEWQKTRYGEGENTLPFTQAVPAISNGLRDIKQKIDESIERLNTAIDGGKLDDKKKAKKLDELKKLAEEYQIKYKEWKAKAKSTDTDMGREDVKEIYGDENNLKAYPGIDEDCKEITGPAVTDLKNRLCNIRTKLKQFREDIDKIQFGNTKLYDIESFDTLKNKIKSGISESVIPLKVTDINELANNKFGEKWSPKGGITISTMKPNDNAYNLEIDPVTEQVETPRLYIYLHKKFEKVQDDVLEKQKEDKEGAKGARDKAESDAKDKGRYHFKSSAKGTIERDYSNGKGASILSDFLKSGIQLFKSLADDNAGLESIRDNLYVAVYIMNMFSYATYQDEAMFRMIQKDDPEKSAKLSIPMFGSPSVPSEYNSEDMKTRWSSKKPKNTYNKSLTNKMISLDNNVAYCAEVEYILYGKVGSDDGKKNASEENIKQAYTNIFLLRYPLNLVSGFQHFWGTGTTIGKLINGIGETIQGLTWGIIPAPLVKIILILLLSATETAVDLNRLEAGFPVEIYKADVSDWKLEPKGLNSKSGFSDFVKALSGEGIKVEAGNKGLFYSDYLMLFVYCALGNKEVAPQIYKRLGEVIQTNIGAKITPGGESKADNKYTMRKAQVYFQLDAKVRVKPIMITLPYFADYKNNLDKNTDWCTFDVKTVRGY